jgi:hypothetical protein
MSEQSEEIKLQDLLCRELGEIGRKLIVRFRTELNDFNINYTLIGNRNYCKVDVYAKKCKRKTRKGPD